MHVSNAQITVEIEMDLTGYIEPECQEMGATVEDIVVDYVYIERAEFKDGKRVIRRINLLDGVDIKSADVQRLLSNILDAQASEVECALMENA